MSKEEYWVEGKFVEFWSKRSYYCYKKDLFVPKKYTLKLEENRIYIDPTYIKGLKIKKKQGFYMKNKFDLYSHALLNSLNVPDQEEKNLGPAVELP